jgi:hypothetical protein
MGESRLHTTDLTVDRRRYYAAVGLFLIWVAVLGTLAVLSGRQPEPTSAPVEKR